jgi:hypothetical protein
MKAASNEAFMWRNRTNSGKYLRNEALKYRA